MEYHKDRFDDYSLMVYNSEQLIAILPANISKDTLHSHQGLTYGGLAFKKDLNSDQIEDIYGDILFFLKAKNIKSLVIKSLPDFYNFQSPKPANLWQAQDNGSVIKRNKILTIDYNSEFKIHKTKLKRYKKLEQNNFEIREGKQEFKEFWNTILVKRLQEKHNSKPVHSLKEIEYLHAQFENRILQYNIYKDNEILAGITILNKGLVVKSQYGMASINGERLNALDMLFVFLINKYKEEGMQYFSMGTVNDDSKSGYSEGMLKQKQELGCSTYFQDIIKLDLND